MKTKLPLTKPPKPPKRPAAPRPRARRGNVDDHLAVRQQILMAAFRLQREPGGIHALSMRSLAAQVGLSAMGLYGYFASKDALLQAMWEQVLTDALSFTSAAAFKGLTARARLMAGIEAFLDYWEREPENFQLVFMSSTTVDPGEKSRLTDNAAYQNAVRLGSLLIDDFIREVDGDPARREEARDLRMALMVGYLHARLVNRRFAWGDFEALRRNTTQTIVMGIEACVTQRPTAPSANGPG